MILTGADDRFVPLPFLADLAPLIASISQASGLTSLEIATQTAVEAIGFGYFVFTSGVARDREEPFRPVLATLPRSVCDALWSHQVFKSNPVLDHIRRTETGIVVEFSTLPPGPAALKAKELLGPLGVTGAAVTPVISATEHLTLLAAYDLTGSAATARALEPLRLIGTAVSLRMLTLCTEQPRSALTDMQREILKWAAAGKSAGDIAVITGLSRRGCEYHLGEIYRKLGVTSRSQAVAAFARGAA